MSSIFRALLIATMGCFAAQVIAHSTVKSTNPASGSILPASPARIVIDFNEPARLISVVLVAAGVPDRKLSFTPAAMAGSFTVPDPKLTAGRNEIRWKALSGDGHPVAGSLIIVVKPGASAPSIPANAPATDSHQHDRH